MRNIKDCETLSVSQLQQEIKLRYLLVQEMRGTLYPSIVQDEIYKLQDLLYKIKLRGIV